MASLYDILADAQHGDAMAELGREFGLTSQQTQAAAAALLPAISMGLKRATATPEGLGDLFSLMGQQADWTQCTRTRRRPSLARSCRWQSSPSRHVRLARREPRDRRPGTTILGCYIEHSEEAAADPGRNPYFWPDAEQVGTGFAVSPRSPSATGRQFDRHLRQIFQQGGAEPTGQTKSPIPRLETF